jgi:bifunctional oligoribonuclease and PAP phosphatase NrnA
MIETLQDERTAAVESVLEALRGASRVILTTHLNADGDGVGCQAALLELLSEFGVEAWVVNPTPFPDTFRFLIRDPSRILDVTSEEAAQRCGDADLCVVVDTGEAPRIGRVNPLITGVPRVVIDHHPPGERAIEGISLRDPGAGAAGELVFDLIAAAGGPWTPPVVEGLYVAILTDTGSFRFSNSTPQLHRVAAELIERGASPDQLHRQVYGSHKLRRFELLRRCLATLRIDLDGQFAWMVVPREDYRDLGCTPEDLDGFVDVPREIEGVEVAVLIREMEEESAKISFRSNGTVDVNRLARRFGGGGHVRAAGALAGGSVKELVDGIREAARGALDADGPRPDRGGQEPPAGL